MIIKITVQMTLKNVNLEKKSNRIVLPVLFILFFITLTNAQINTEVGYTGAYIPAKLTNKIFDRYNNNNLLMKIKPLNYTGGFNAGISYRFGPLKTGIFWDGLSASRSGIEGSLDNNQALEKNLFFYFNSFSGSIEISAKHLGIGAKIDYNDFKVKTKISGATSKIPIIKDNYYSSKFYLVFYLRGTDRFGLALKPYIRVPWEKVSVMNLADFLSIQQNDAFNHENLIQFGLTIDIINGIQPDFD